MSISKMATGVALALLLAAAGLAHDPSKHKGRATKGEVVSVAGDRLELRTAAGLKAVTLNEKTKYERGDQIAAKADLKAGEQVTVFGTTLATGELVAREVLLEGARKAGSQKSGVRSQKGKS